LIAVTSEASRIAFAFVIDSASCVVSPS